MIETKKQVMSQSQSGFWRKNALAIEITAVLLFKLVVIIAIKNTWFSDPVERADAHAQVRDFYILTESETEPRSGDN